MRTPKKPGLFSKTNEFLNRDLWQRKTADLPWLQRNLYQVARTIVIVGRGFVEDQLLLRASALTYSTLLALVPCFALAFAALKGFGIHNQVEPWILDRVAAGARETVSQIVQYVNNTDVRALGAVGLVLLLFTVVSVVSNVEKSLNTIWGVKKSRSWWRRFSDYLSIVVLAPIVLFATLTVTATLQARTAQFVGSLSDIPVIGWIAETLAESLPSLGTVLPYLILWAFFTFVYFYLPNTKVRFRSALLAGLIAGVLWQLMQWGYVRFQIGVAKYNAIYGTLAQLPVLLVWLYLSWVVFLLGAAIAFAHQHLRTFEREREAGAYSHRDREILGVRMMIEIARSFAGGGESWSAERLSEHLNAPLRLVNETLFQLKGGGLLAEVNTDSEARYLLARDLDSIEFYDILSVLKRFPQTGTGEIRDSYVHSLLDRAEESQKHTLEKMTLRQAIAQEASK